MKLTAVNIAERRAMTNNTGSFETGIYKQSVAAPVLVTTLGIAEDAIVDTAVHGGVDQAVYLYPQEDYDWWSEQLGTELTPGTFGENLIIEGLAGRDILIGDILTINQLVLEVTAPRIPCHKLATRMGSAAFLKQFIQANRPGFYGRVLVEGKVAAGDDVSYSPSSQDYASITEVFHQWHAKEKSMVIIKKALQSPVSMHHRVKLEQWYQAGQTQVCR